MQKLEIVIKNNVLKMTPQFDTTATYKEVVGTLVIAESRMTSTLYILESENGVILTISNAVSYKFDNVEKLNNYLTRKEFKAYSSEKEMYMDFAEMDEETWEEWNK